MGVGSVGAGAATSWGEGEERWRVALDEREMRTLNTHVLLSK